MKYTFRITETYYNDFEIEADSPEQAEQIANELYLNLDTMARHGENRRHKTMKAYKAYYDRGWNILEFDASKARRIGGYLNYNGWIYGPADEIFTCEQGARLWIEKEYGKARAYQITLEQAKKEA